MSDETMDQKVIRLHSIAADKQNIAWNLQCKLSILRGELQSKYNKLIEEEITKVFGTSVYDAQKEQYAADKAWKEAINEREIAKSLTKLPHAEGTVLVKWGSSGWSSRTFHPTKEKGIFQIFRDGDEYPSNQRWSRVSPGDFVVRSLKNDGTAGIKVVRFCPDYWKLEGFDPNKKVEKTA